jgi:hypothetical protein
VNEHQAATHDRIKRAIQCAVFDKEVHPEVAACMAEELDRLIAVDKEHEQCKRA